jgi:hypothetical protein
VACCEAVHATNTNHQLICTMLDRLTFRSRIKPYHRDDSTRFAQVFIAQHSQAKAKPTITYIDSPLTGAQLEITPSVERDIYDNDWLVLTVEVFVAAAIAGQNYVHADMQHVPAELSCVAGLVRVVLAREGFTPEEIDFFLKYTVQQEMELCWHRATASRRAARALLLRAQAHFQALEEISSRHDSLVTQVDVQTSHARTTVLVSFKDDCKLRLYLKAEQAEVRTKRKRRLSFVSKAVRPYIKQIEAAVDAHLRIEPIFSESFLKDHGMPHPGSVTPETIAAALKDFMAMARLDMPFAMGPEDVDTTGLSPEVLGSLVRHFNGANLEAELEAHTFTRHRQALLPHGVELAVVRLKSNPALGHTLYKQLAYENRWLPPAALLPHAVTWDTAPGFRLALDAMLPDSGTAGGSEHEQQQEGGEEDAP